MKKTIIALAAIMLLISCGGSSETLDPVDSTVTTNPVEATDPSAIADSVSVADSSVGAIQGGGSSGDDVTPIEDKDNELIAPTKRVRGEVIK